MIAQVYPFVRLPRRFGFFDYRIPEGMKIGVGDIVAIRFRGRPMFGVVRGLTEKSAFPKLFSIEKRVWSGFMTSDDVARIERIANIVVQAPATVFYVTYGFLKGREKDAPHIESPRVSVSVPAATASRLADIMQAIEQHEETFIQTSMEGSFALAHLLRKRVKNQLLIIAPRGRVAIDLTQSVSLGTNVGFLTGQTTPTTREATVRAWALGKIDTLVATRIGARLAAKDIGAILILESSSDDYVTLERNPRIDARLAAELLAHQHQAKLIHTGPTPDVMSLHRHRHILWDDNHSAEIVNLKALQERTETPLLTQTLQKRITETLQTGQNVLVSFNKKARKQGEKIPGNKELAQLFAHAFPTFRVGVYDKLHKEDGSILLVTEAYFKNTLPAFSAKRFGLVVELDFDLSFSGTDYEAKEQAAYKLYRLSYVAKQQHARLVVQTWTPESVQELLNTKSFLTNELKTRQQYQLPPVVPRAEITPNNKLTTFTPLTDARTDDLKNLPDNCIIVINTDTYEP